MSVSPGLVGHASIIGGAMSEERSLIDLYERVTAAFLEAGGKRCKIKIEVLWGPEENEKEEGYTPELSFGPIS
jgi:hypothetical protein